MGVQLPSEPITRKERYLAKAAGQAVEVPAEPITREEAYLAAIAEGSGGGGTTNYNNLSNQPQINGNTLIGNKSASDLGLVAAETGKGLSENNYTDNDKAKVDASLNVFTGTQAEWEALSTAEKKKYQRADFTDDYDPTAIGDLTALHTSAKSSIVNAINEVKDGLTNLVKSNTITLTTATSGHASTPIRDTVKVLQVKSDGFPCLAFTFNGFWFFAPLTWDASTLQLSLKPSAEVTFTYYYVD